MPLVVAGCLACSLGTLALSVDLAQLVAAVLYISWISPLVHAPPFGSGLQVATTALGLKVDGKPDLLHLVIRRRKGSCSQVPNSSPSAETKMTSFLYT